MDAFASLTAAQSANVQRVGAGADSTFALLASGEYFQSTVNVGKGTASLERCLFFNNFATVPSVVHTSGERGIRLMLRNINFGQNEVPSEGDPPTRVSQVDDSAIVLAPEPESVNVWNVKKQESSLAWNITAQGVREFLSSQDPWLEANLAAVVVDKQPFWRDSPEGGGKAPVVNAETAAAAKAERSLLPQLSDKTKLSAAAIVLIVLACIVVLLCIWVCALRKQRELARRRIDSATAAQKYTESLPRVRTLASCMSVASVV